MALGLLVFVCFGDARLAVLAGVLLLGIHGVINYAQAGVSYIPGLAASSCSLLLGVLCVQRGSTRMAVSAGIAAAIAVLFWLPFVLILPALFCAPWLLTGSRPGTLRPLLTWLFVACACTGIVGYGIGVTLAGVPPAEFTGWLRSAGHSIEGSGGVPRVALGVARSFVYLGSDPGIVKRFLIGDPFHPVAAGDLLMLPIWPRLILFYGAAVGMLAIAAAPGRGRTFLVLLLTAAVPCIGFGLFWQGGDIERYMPLYPFVVLCICAAINTLGRRLTWMSASCLAILGLNNVVALARPNVRSEQRAIAQRAECDSIAPGSLLVLPNWHDPLINVYRTTGGNGILPDGIRMVAAVTPMGSGADQWQSWIARRMLDVSDDGGQVWISKRSLSSEPTLGSGWLEGEDPRLHWADIAGLFGSLSTVDPCGASDGFVKLEMDARTRNILEQAVGSATAMLDVHATDREET